MPSFSDCFQFIHAAIQSILSQINSFIKTSCLVKEKEKIIIIMVAIKASDNYDKCFQDDF